MKIRIRTEEQCKALLDTLAYKAQESRRTGAYHSAFLRDIHDPDRTIEIEFKLPFKPNVRRKRKPKSLHT